MTSNPQHQPGFVEDENGTVLMLFGLCFMVLMMVAGLAVDSARGYRTASDGAAALDAAALATAKALRLENPTDDEVRDLAQKFFAANLRQNGRTSATYEALGVEIDRELNLVRLSVDLKLPTTIGVVMGRDKFDIPVRSSAVFDSRNVELSMMLDVSGSMAGRRITDLKVAVKDLVDIMLADAEGTDHKIAYAPFSNAVNAGIYADAATGGSGSGSCVSERGGANAFRDKNPQIGGYFGRPSGFCPMAPIMPLSNDRDVLKNAVDAMQVGGMTAGHLGIAWAWYLLSPEWSDFWPADSAPRPYGDRHYAKVAILMTDGQFNRTYVAANGSADEQGRRLCDNMRSSGVTIYTIAFEAPPEALPVLEYCASSPSHFFDARNGAQLRQTFQTIAKRLMGLRLTS